MCSVCLLKGSAAKVCMILSLMGQKEKKKKREKDISEFSGDVRARYLSLNWLSHQMQHEDNRV